MTSPIVIPIFFPLRCLQDLWPELPEPCCRWPRVSSSGHRYLGWTGAGLKVADLCCQRSWLYSHHPLTARPGTASQTHEPGNLEQDRKDEVSKKVFRRHFSFHSFPKWLTFQWQTVHNWWNNIYVFKGIFHITLKLEKKIRIHHNLLLVPYLINTKPAKTGNNIIYNNINSISIRLPMSIHLKHWSIPNSKTAATYYYGTFIKKNIKNANVLISCCLTHCWSPWSPRSLQPYVWSRHCCEWWAGTEDPKPQDPADTLCYCLTTGTRE